MLVTCYHTNEQHSAAIDIQSYLMIIRVTIRPTRNMFDSVVAELPKETGVAAMPKVLLQYLGLFEPFGHQYPKGASMRQPSDPLLVLLLGEHVVNLLRESHITDLLGVIVVHLGRHGREVPVRVVHVGPGLLDDLDCPGLHREFVVLCPSPSPFALLLNGIVKGGGNQRLGGFSRLLGAGFVASLLEGGGIGMATIVQACEDESGGGAVFSVHGHGGHGGRWSCNRCQRKTMFSDS
jgi:hypothetical protein